MKTILFGFGRAGKIHFENINNNGALNLTHVVELHDVSKLIGKSKYVDFNNKQSVVNLLKNNSIKCVIVASPTKTHYDLIKMALDYNKHVFVEKPITKNYNEIIECFNLANKKNLILFVGYNRRFDPTIKSIYDQVRKNQIGKINYALTISRDYPYPSKDYLKISSGIFHDCATHDIDYMNWILGDKPTCVNVQVNDNEKVEDYNYEHVTINLKYSLGTLVCLNLSRISSSYDQRCEFYGEKGEIINNKFLKDQKLSFPQRYKNAFKNEIEEFCKCINENVKAPISMEDCLNNHIIAEACQESIDNNKKITIKYGEGYRNYDMTLKRVSENYFLARKNQTLEFVKNMHKKFSKFELKLHIWDIMEKLNTLVDVSDPDCSHPNLYHAIQTAEMIRKDGHPDWLQLVGLMHDIGKIMYLKGNDNEGTGINKQWAMVGDTFVLGCKLPEKIIFPEFNIENPDMKNSLYNTELGIYEEGCGLDNVHCSWGHDEYLYRILKSDKNPHFLPEEALYIIRFHSLYVYHEQNEYNKFQSQKDKDMFKYLKLFNKYDLYSKTDDISSINDLKCYYNELIKKYFKNDYLYI